MTTPNHSDLQRDIGALSANDAAMEKRLDRIEKMIEAGFKELREEIAELKTKDAQRGALERAAVWIAGAVGGLIALVISHVWK